VSSKNRAATSSETSVERKSGRRACVYWFDRQASSTRSSVSRASPAGGSASSKPRRPICEATSRVPGTDDQTRARHKRVCESRANDVFAKRLQWTVRLIGVFLRLLLELHDLVALTCTGGAGALRVDRHRRDECVVTDVAECVDGRSYDPGHKPGRVDDGVKAATNERSEVAVAIAAQLLELRKELGTRLAAVEQRDIVAARDRRFHDVAAEEDRATEDQDVHRFSLALLRAGPDLRSNPAF
jgi:hypothetical protein